jgi:hypothetical protein
MEKVIFRYRARQLDTQAIQLIRAIISKHYQRGRSHISRVLCEAWQWVQPNGKLKEYAARDLLLRLEEQGLVQLPKRLRPKNNLKKKTFDQIPLFLKQPIHGSAGEYGRPCIELVHAQGSYLWDYLLHHHHYLGLPKLVGEHLRYGKPEIFNTDQGAQFTSNEFTQTLKDHQVAISMDGRGRCQDNIFVERLWWTIKHNYLYLHSFRDGSQLRTGLNEWIRYYNRERGHSSLDDRTPDEVYYCLHHPFAEAA